MYRRSNGTETVRLVGGYKALHAGGDGRSNGVGIIVSEEINKQLVRVGRWEGRIFVARLVVEANGVLCRYMGRK